MTYRELLEQYDLNESLLLSVSLANYLRDVLLEFSVGPMNAGASAVPVPEGRFTLICTNYVSLHVDRDPALAAFRHPLDAVPDAQVGRMTVWSHSSDGDSPLLARLGQASDDYQHLAVETTDGLVEVVFEDLEIGMLDAERVGAIDRA